MKTKMLFCAIAFAAAACSSGDSGPRVSSMNAEQLAAYNQNLPPEEQVVCSSQRNEFSRVRVKTCKTRGELASARQAVLHQNRTNNRVDSPIRLIP